MSDKMREAFEKWAKAECLDLDSVDGFYSDNDTHIAWGAWQAAQSAAVPVVGEVVAYLKSWSSDGRLHQSASTYEGCVWPNATVFPLILQPTTSISAAELDALRKDAERYRWIRDASESEPAAAEFWPAIRLQMDKETDALWCIRAQLEWSLDAAIDAAIAGEKNHG